MAPPSTSLSQYTVQLRVNQHAPSHAAFNCEPRASSICDHAVATHISAQPAASHTGTLTATAGSVVTQSAPTAPQAHTKPARRHLRHRCVAASKRGHRKRAATSRLSAAASVRAPHSQRARVCPPPSSARSFSLSCPSRTNTPARRAPLACAEVAPAPLRELTRPQPEPEPPPCAGSLVGRAAFVTKVANLLSCRGRYVCTVRAHTRTCSTSATAGALRLRAIHNCGTRTTLFAREGGASATQDFFFLHPTLTLSFGGGVCPGGELPNSPSRIIRTKVR